MRRTSLREHHEGIYTCLLLSGKLISHLNAVDETANTRIYILTKQMAVANGITELEVIRATHIKLYMQILIKKQLTPGHSNSILRCIRAYFGYAVEEVRALRNIFEFSTYLSARNKLVLAITFNTGARKSDICSILEGNIRDNVKLIHASSEGRRNPQCLSCTATYNFTKI